MEYSGGSIKMCLEYEPSSFLTYEISDYYSATILQQSMEGLVSIDPTTLKIKPQIASSWTISDDQTHYIFTIRDDVYFHENPIFATKSERKLTLEDIIATFKLAASPNANSNSTIAYNHLLKGTIKGVEDFFNKKTKDISGIYIKDEKIHIELTQRDDNFLNKLSQIQLTIHSDKVIKSKAVAQIIGTGPFQFHSAVEENDVPVYYLTKNNDYYEEDEKGNQLPYLDTVKFIIENRKIEQLILFENQHVDMILALPTSKITQMVEEEISNFNSIPPKYILDKNALLQTHYYYFNMEDERFKDVRVRQAFNYAFNKEKLGRDVLKNQYEELGLYGIVPPLPQTFRAYDFNSIKQASYKYNPEKAKRLLAEAGYPNGKGFGTVNLRFNIGDINSAVAEEFSQQIYQVLGIVINIDGSSFEQMTDDAIKGNGDIFKSSWVADYPNPENFLDNFRSSNIPSPANNNVGMNYSKYFNPQFEETIEQAYNETNAGKKMKLFSKAETELMKNPPIIPLWYSGDIQIIHSYVRNLHFNSLSVFNFKNVYIKKWTAEEYQKEIANKK